MRHRLEACDEELPLPHDPIAPQVLGHGSAVHHFVLSGARGRNLGVERYSYADFFFGFGLVAFGMTGASGVPSIEDRRPEVKV